MKTEKRKVVILDSQDKDKIKHFCKCLEIVLKNSELECSCEYALKKCINFLKGLEMNIE